MRIKKVRIRKIILFKVFRIISYKLVLEIDVWGGIVGRVGNSWRFGIFYLVFVKFVNVWFEWWMIVLVFCRWSGLCLWSMVRGWGFWFLWWCWLYFCFIILLVFFLIIGLCFGWRISFCWIELKEILFSIIIGRCIILLCMVCLVGYKVCIVIVYYDFVINCWIKF